MSEKEEAINVAAHYLREEQDNVKKQLDILRKTRPARGGTGAPLSVPRHLEIVNVVSDGELNEGRSRSSRG